MRIFRCWGNRLDVEAASGGERQMVFLLSISGEAPPTTYVANALLASVAGRVTSRTWREIRFLAAWTLLSLWAASRKLAWRASE